MLGPYRHTRPLVMKVGLGIGGGRATTLLDCNNKNIVVSSQSKADACKKRVDAKILLVRWRLAREKIIIMRFNMEENGGSDV